jgi:hypothetical protein
MKYLEPRTSDYAREAYLNGYPIGYNKYYDDVRLREIKEFYTDEQFIKLFGKSTFNRLFQNEQKVKIEMKEQPAKQKKTQIKLKWNTKTEKDTGRIGAMYCFKRCDINMF